MITFKLNGKIVQGEEGQYILQVAQKYGVDIPTLCHHKALEPAGMCRLCTVEVFDGRRTRFVTSCNYPIWEGMEVKTDTEDIHKGCKLIVELLMARCPDVPVLKELGKKYGISETRFKKENDTCILCGLCTRICARMGNSAISLTGRGVDMKVDTPFHIQTDVCMACGACASVCPTGHITLEKIREQVTTHSFKPILSEYNMGLKGRKPIYVPYAQAIPNTPVIDRSVCIHFKTGGCKVCAEFCGVNAIDYTMQDEVVEINVGAIILAPGFEFFDAGIRGEYGYGRYTNVVTSIQFERILSASGPYFGHVQRLSDGKEPKKIAFIQCVGSRDTSCGNSWCSSVCCMYATKEAIVGKEHARELEPTIFFMDIRAHGKDFDRFVNRAKEEYGIRYIRSIPSSVKELQQTKDLMITYVMEDGRLVEEEFDMVVLSVGLTPPAEASELAGSLGMDLDEYGFCKTSLENPVQTSRPGVFVCGAFGGPKDIPETVVEASAAAACAGELLAGSRGSLITEEELPLEKDLRGIGPRTGVFVCHCGINIGGVVDVPGVVEYAKSLPTVVYATDNLFTCSQDAAVKMADIIREQNLTRVVVASCSPRTHEGLFQENCEKAGLNRYLFEMANIRDQNSWVHMHEPEKATEKAKDLVRMSVAKAGLLKPLKPGQLSVNHAALIIGGGLSGITAALSLAQQGYPSCIVEKEGELGGNYRRLHYTLEGLDTKRHLSDLIEKVGNNTLIEVYRGAEIRKIEGFIGNYKTTIGTNDGERLFEHGVVIIATGGYELKTEEYQYGALDQVVTQRELEGLIAGNDASISRAKSVVMIQCVGSREAERPYCSRYCCSQAVKNALKLKESDAEREVTIIYRDIRTFGLKEDYYKKARERDVRFIRYEEDRKPEVTKDGQGVVVSVYDPVLNEPVEIRGDILALGVATLPNPQNEAIGRMLKVPTNQDGFFLEAHVKLKPVEFATDGVFLCGLAHAPKFSNESLVQARAAVSRASVILTKDFILSEGKTAYVDRERCMACGLCEINCPFGAVAVDPLEACAVVNAVLCKGCGVCTASCRMNAIDLNGFSNEEVLSQLRALQQ